MALSAAYEPALSSLVVKSTRPCRHPHHHAEPRALAWGSRGCGYWCPATSQLRKRNMPTPGRDDAQTPGPLPYPRLRRLGWLARKVLRLASLLRDLVQRGTVRSADQLPSRRLMSWPDGVRAGQLPFVLLRAWVYCSSVTGSSHVVLSPPASPTTMAMCATSVVSVPPCQCSPPAGHLTICPALTRTTLPSRVTEQGQSRSIAKRLVPVAIVSA